MLSANKRLHIYFAKFACRHIDPEMIVLPAQFMPVIYILKFLLSRK